MREIRRLFLAMALICGLPSVAAAGGVCMVVELDRTRPVEVNVENVREEFCGAAMIGDRVRPLKDAARHQIMGPVTCNRFTRECRRRIDYYIEDANAPAPKQYTVILVGQDA